MHLYDQEADLGKIEGLFAPRWPDVFRNLADSRRKKNLARYLAIQHLRHPSRLAHIERQNQSMLELLSKTPEDTEKVEMQLLDGTIYTVKIADYRNYLHDRSEREAVFLWMMRASTEDLAKILFERKWGIIESEDPHFVTSDCPLTLSRGDSQRRVFGFRTPGTEIFFPITPHALLVISDAWPYDSACIERTNFSKISAQSDWPFNLPQLKSASRFIFSSTQTIPGIF